MVSGCLGLGGLWLGHVEIPASIPDGGSLDCYGSDEAKRTGAVREGADAPDATLDLSLETLEAVGGAKPCPMGLGEGEEDRRRGEAIPEALHRLGHLAAETHDEGVQSLASLGPRGSLEDGGGLLPEPASESPGGLGEDVPGQMDRAPLELGFGQGQTGGGGEAGVTIGETPCT